MTDHTVTPPARLGIRAVSDPGLAAITDAVIASLPISLDHDDQGVLAAVPGAGNWAEHTKALLTNGLRGVLVDHPEALSVNNISALREAAAQREASIVLRLPWVSHPAVADAIGAWAPVREELVVIDSVVTGVRLGSNATMAAAQLALVMAVAGPVQNLTVDACDEQGYALRASTIEGVPVSIMAATSLGSSSATVRMLGRMEAFELTAEESSTWKPALAFRASADGDVRRPAIFESADRAAWRTLFQAVTGSATIGLDLYADALELIASVGGLA